MKECVDTVITIPNERLLATLERGTSLFDAFRIADDILRQAVQGISDLIIVPGLINLDFADVKTVMSGMGMALMGTGSATGENRAVEAAKRAISSRLLEDGTIQGARGVLINITGGHDLLLHEVSEASSIIHEAADPEANIIFGAVLDERMKDEVKITVIATGFVGRGEPLQTMAAGAARNNFDDAFQTVRPLQSVQCRISISPLFSAVSGEKKGSDGSGPFFLHPELSQLRKRVSKQLKSDTVTRARRADSPEVESHCHRCGSDLSAQRIEFNNALA